MLIFKMGLYEDVDYKKVAERELKKSREKREERERKAKEKREG